MGRLQVCLGHANHLGRQERPGPLSFFRNNRQKSNNRQSFYVFLPMLTLGEDAALPLWDRCSDVWGASTL